MGRIGEQAKIGPAATAAPIEVSPPVSPQPAAAPVNAPALMTPLDPAPAASRPEPATSKQAEKARASELRGLQQLGMRLSGDLASHVVRSADLLDSAHGALGRASHRFSTAHKDERALCNALRDWAHASLAESSAITAESIVLAQFPDFQSPSHGAFKSLARAMDKAIAARVGEAEQDANMRGFVLGQHSDPHNPAEQSGKEAGALVTLAAALVAPPLGALLAFRDLSGLIRQRLQGEQKSNLALAGEGAAAFPLLRLGKVPILAAPAALAEAAELTKISRAGLQKIAERAALQSPRASPSQCVS